MKKLEYNIKIGEVFTRQKATELIKYLKAKDKELNYYLNLLRRLKIK